MIAKYVNPFTDFGFKKIFGEEGSKFLLMDFLNTLLPEENKISSLTLRNSENLPRTELERRAIFDVYCMLNQPLPTIEKLFLMTLIKS